MRPVLIAMLATATLTLAGCFRPTVPAVVGSPATFDPTPYARTGVMAIDGRTVSNTVTGWNSDPYGGKTRGTLAIIESAFNAVLLDKGYELVDRGDFNQVVSELNFQSNFGDSAQKVAELGKAMNVKAILVVRLNSLAASAATGSNTQTGISIGLSAKLIDVTKASIVWQASWVGNQSVMDSSDEALAVERTARGVALALPSLNGWMPNPPAK